MIKISEMTGKLEGIDAINTSPLTNSFCMNQHNNPNAICSKCYSIQMLTTFRKNCEPSMRRNGEELSTRLLTENEILSLKFKYNLVRFNAHGELINVLHAKNLIRIAQLWPSKNFALYTKRASLVALANMKIPANLQLIYSSLKMNQTCKAPRGFHKVFAVYTSKPANIEVNCCDGESPRRCADCRNCYDRNEVTNLTELIADDKKRAKLASQTKKAAKSAAFFVNFANTMATYEGFGPSFEDTIMLPIIIKDNTPAPKAFKGGVVLYNGFGPVF